MDKTFKVVLYRRASAVSQAQFRGMVAQTIDHQMVLEADTKESLDQMVKVAAVDGWRKDK